MVVANKLKEFLAQNKVKYEIIQHREAYTAPETAAALHVKGKYLAKVVILKHDDKLAMAVLPASHKVDPKKFEIASGLKKVKLAGEDDFVNLFADCEAGAEPPFGNLYGIETYVDKTLSEDEMIYFNAGTHREIIEMNYKDYERLVKPKVIDFAAHL